MTKKTSSTSSPVPAWHPSKSFRTSVRPKRAAQCPQPRPSRRVACPLGSDDKLPLNVPQMALNGCREALSSKDTQSRWPFPEAQSLQVFSKDQLIELNNQPSRSMLHEQNILQVLPSMVLLKQMEMPSSFQSTSPMTIQGCWRKGIPAWPHTTAPESSKEV